MASASTSGEVFALVIGIDDYPGTSSDLGAAVADADTIDAALDRPGCARTGAHQPPATRPPEDEPCFLGLLC